MRQRASVIVVILAGLVTAACGSGGENSRGIGSGSDGRVTSVAEGLALLPAAVRPEAAGEPVHVLWGDPELAARIGNLERPDPGVSGDDDEVVDYFIFLVQARRGPAEESDRPLFAPLPEASAPTGGPPVLDEFQAELGWSFLDIDRFIERRVRGDRVTVMDGRFDAAALDAALGDSHDDDNAWIVGDPDNVIGRSRDTSVARRLGESLWLRLDGRTLSVALDPDTSDAASRWTSHSAGAGSRFGG